MKVLSVLWLILAFTLPLIDYPFYIQYETQRRDDFIASNQEYARNPDPRFDTSVPQEWIKSDAAIRQEAVQSVLSDIATNLWVPAMLVLPLLVIRAIAGGSKYKKYSTA